MIPLDYRFRPVKLFISEGSGFTSTGPFDPSLLDNAGFPCSFSRRCSPLGAALVRQPPSSAQIQWTNSWGPVSRVSVPDCPDGYAFPRPLPPPHGTLAVAITMRAARVNCRQPCRVMRDTTGRRFGRLTPRLRTSYACCSELSWRRISSVSARPDPCLRYGRA